MTRVVLASASPGRLQVLRQAGIDPLVIVSGVDEDLVVAGLGARRPPVTPSARSPPPRPIRWQAGSIRRWPPTASWSGCDSMLFIDGELRGKPDDADAARAAWATMAGRSGELYTGHSALLRARRTVVHRESRFGCTTVHFGTPPTKT